MMKAGRYHRIDVTIMIAVALIAVSPVWIFGNQAASPTVAFEPLAADQGVGRYVVVVPVEGTIELGLAPFIRRAIDENSDAAAFVLNVNTFGGRVDAAVQIRDALLECEVPTIAFINRRAISAGALISLAADHIVVAPGASIGAATPVQIQGNEVSPVEEKMVSYMRAEMRATAEATGRDGDIAEAMVDADIEIKDISAKGKLFTATAESALTTKIADAQLQDLSEVVAAFGLARARINHVAPNWSERLVRILTDPTLSGFLMSFGFLALLIELYTPGFGVAGGAGAILLALFFGGHMLAGLAGWEEVLLIVIGLALLAVEIFVLPGFGVAGVTGLVCLCAGFVMALTGHPVAVSWQVGAISSALGRVMLAMGASVALLALIANKLPESPFGSWMVLTTTLGRKGATGSGEGESCAADPRGLIGKCGVAITDLRLSGKAQINNRLTDVVSQHEYLDKGTPVRVIEIEGIRIVVVRDDKKEGV